MPKFIVSMQRTQMAEVTIEAESAAAIRELMADQEVRWEYFTSGGDSYQTGDIKITGVKPKAENIDHRYADRASLSARAQALTVNLIKPANGLKVWNGGEGSEFLPKSHPWYKTMKFNASISVYACASSRAELVRMLTAYRGGDLWPGAKNRIANYWHEGSWGNPMDGITPEPGIWIQRDYKDRPVRVWPKEKAE